MRSESQAVYRHTMSRWKRETALAIRDPLFWPVVQLASLSRKPCDHLLNFLQKPVDSEALALRGGHLAQLQQGKAAAMMAEFASEAAAFPLESLVADIPGDMRYDFVNTATHVFLQAEVQLQRRIVDKLNEPGAKSTRNCQVNH